MRQLIHQRALPCSRRARQAQDLGASAMRKKSFQQIRVVGAAIFDGCDSACQRTKVSLAHPLHQVVKLWVQADSVKQGRDSENNAPQERNFARIYSCVATQEDRSARIGVNPWP